MRDLLQGLGLQSFVKTTGGKGLHVVAPVRPTLRAGTKSSPSPEGLTHAIVQADPEHYTANMALKKRPGQDLRRLPAQRTRRDLRHGVLDAAPSRRPRLDAAALGRAVPLPSRALHHDEHRRRLSSLDEDPWEGFADVRQAVTPAMLRSPARVAVKPRHA